MNEALNKPMSEDELALLMRQISMLNRDPSRVYSKDFDGVVAGAKSYGGPNINPFAALPTALGLLEVEASPRDKTASAKARRQDQVGEGVLTSEITKGINSPEELIRLLYQQPAAGGQLSAQATLGRGAYDQPVKMLEVEYLRQILKNLGLGAYYQSNPYGQSAGLRLQGRF